jgi:demethylmenaquinone methyltransferase/2-methoxy-6-polyprenyl-1,4-benzoquinol methylase
MSDAVKNMFNAISRYYDLMNTVLSLGIHHRWRRKAVKLSGAKENQSVLDLACGTGDFAFQFKKVVGENGKVVGVDYSDSMMKIARAKASKKSLNVDFCMGDVLNLQFEDNSFDFASISFGIRNVTSPVKCLQEMARVVKPAGKVVIVELGQPDGIIKRFYSFYSLFFIPVIGKIFTGNKSAYLYLHNSASTFPCRGQFLKLMEQSQAFSRFHYYSLTFGIAYIYIGHVR